MNRYLSVLGQLASLLLISLLLESIWFTLWVFKDWPGAPDFLAAWLGTDGDVTHGGMADAMAIICLVFLLAVWILTRIVLPRSASVLGELGLLLLASFLFGSIWWNLWMNGGWPGGPDLLARWIGADGEGAYNAMENEMSIICFVFLLAVWILTRIVFPRSSSVPGRSALLLAFLMVGWNIWMSHDWLGSHLFSTWFGADAIGTNSAAADAMGIISFVILLAGWILMRTVSRRSSWPGRIEAGAGDITA